MNSWDEVREKIKGRCPGCPRDPDKVPVLFKRTGPPERVAVIVLSQEPGHWLRPLASGEAAEQKLSSLCRDGSASVAELRKADPLSKLQQMFGRFDPSNGRIYWTHALKCIPARSDRDINKEWRKAATRCEAYFLEELRSLGREQLSVVAFGKYPLEMCLHLFDGQDIDQELSISEFMQSSRLPLSYKYKFKDGTVKNIELFVFTNPSSEVVKIVKSGGKRTVEEIQELEAKRLAEMLQSKRA